MVYLPTLALSPDDFVILLMHTPDYAEDVAITNTDLVLAGHTHGGQVTLFGLYAPILPSHYGQRFRGGLKRNSQGIPMIITNGLGTSNKNIRMFAPQRGGGDRTERSSLIISSLNENRNYSSGISTTPSFFLPSIFTVTGCSK